MELKDTPMKTEEKAKFERAKKRVAEVKGFYTHLLVYVLVNLFLLAANLGLFSGSPIKLGMPDWAYFTTPFFWGISLALHGLWVFSKKMDFLKNWEERKIKEYMDKY